MNERFKELRDEAFRLTEWETLDYDAILEKFAELIVKEVFVKIEDERFEVYQPVKESVMKYFGVE